MIRRSIPGVTEKLSRTAKGLSACFLPSDTPAAACEIKSTFDYATKVLPFPELAFPGRFLPGGPCFNSVLSTPMRHASTSPPPPAGPDAGMLARSDELPRVLAAVRPRIDLTPAAQQRVRDALTAAVAPMLTEEGTIPDPRALQSAFLQALRNESQLRNLASLDTSKDCFAVRLFMTHLKQCSDRGVDPEGDSAVEILARLLKQKPFQIAMKGDAIKEFAQDLLGSVPWKVFQIFRAESADADANTLKLIERAIHDTFQDRFVHLPWPGDAELQKLAVRLAKTKVFCLDYLETVPWAEMLSIDYSFGMNFVGRTGLMWEVAHYAAKLFNHPFEKPTALVLSTSSGAGKTVGFLQLKAFLRALYQKYEERGESYQQWVSGIKESTDKTFKDLMPFDDLVKILRRATPVVVYSGFNACLTLSIEEVAHIRVNGQQGAEEVLARRIVGVAAYSLRNPTETTRLPWPAQLFGNRTIPPVEDSMKMLCTLLTTGAANLPNSPRLLIVGVDEVQKLDGDVIIVLEDGKSIGLGRLFLRILREWQVKLRDSGIALLPIGIGIGTDFSTGTTDGDNKMLSVVGDAVHISQSDYNKVALEICKRDDMTPQEALKAKMTARTMTALMWPHMRFLQWTKNVEAPMIPNVFRLYLLASTGTTISDREHVRDLLTMYLHQLVGVPVDGAIGGRVLKDQLVPFVMRTATSYELVANGFLSLFLRNAIRSLFGPKSTMTKVVDMLPAISHNNVTDIVNYLIPTQWQTFEDRGFPVVAMALHTGLVATLTLSKREPAATLRAVEMWALIDWIQTSVDCSLECLQASTYVAAKKKMSPFKYGKIKTRFEPELRRLLSRVGPVRAPVYVRGGSQSPADYYYFFPAKADPRGWVAVVVDARHTLKEQDAAITTCNVNQLRGAAGDVRKCVPEAGARLLGIQLCILSNRRKVPPNDDQEAVTYLTPKTFNFPPFSHLIFVDEPAEEDKVVNAVADAADSTN